ncbi:MAG: type 1 glutamine amidotransferase [Chromatiales bacterium]
MRILVFQHLDIEHPGIFGDFLKADGIPWDVVELDEGDSIPALDGYDALVVMGGPMDVWEEDEYPWLIAEKRAIREAVAERNMPYLGICLGHQLLGDALGGRVGKMPGPEVGIADVQLTDAAQRDPMFKGIAPTSNCLQWHGAAVLEPPSGATVLARSPLCEVQAMRVDPNAYGIQYHVEVTQETVPQWAAIPAYKAALERALGQGAAARLERETTSKLPAFAKDARTLYENFMRIVRTRRSA